MKMQRTKRVAGAVLAGLMLAVLLAGCGGGAGGNVVITDMMNREVTVQQPVDKVVALSAADCEILYAIGAGELLAGRGEYCDWPAEVLAVPSVQSGYETNTEQIIALEPQVVFMSTMAQTTEQVSQLEAAGSAVVVSEATDVAGVYSAIEIIGKAVGKEKEAAGLVQSMQQSFAGLEAKVPQAAEQKTVYFEVSPLEWGLWTAGSATFMDELATMLGLRNIFSDVEGWAEISQEQVIERNPDYIVTITLYQGEGPLPEEEIMQRAGWGGIAAVQNGAVFNANGDEISRPGPRLVNAAEALYEFVYGA